MSSQDKANAIKSDLKQKVTFVQIVHDMTPQDIDEAQELVRASD